MKNKLRNYLLPSAIAALLMLPGSGALKAQEKLRPFILAWQGAAKVETKVAEMKSKLAGNGFEILSVHSPYPQATIVSFTSAALKRNAAESASGGYGAAQRLAVTAVGGQVQVSYTNPAYMANAYRMAGDLTGVAAKLQTILGKKSDFGSEKGLAAKKLRKYHYMFGMEYFDDPSELAEFGSFSQALTAVEQGLAAGRGGVTKVYRVDLPGKNETVFGVALSTECSGVDYIMSRIDF